MPHVVRACQRATSGVRAWPAWLAAILAAAALALAVGSTKALPYPEADEPVFARSSRHIAATGDLNPHWFGHPGATVIYPLAAAMRVTGDAISPYALGRAVSMVYALATVLAVFGVGRATFGSVAGLIAAWLTAMLPIVVAHGQVVRSDSAATCFALLSLWQCARLAGGVTGGVAIARSASDDGRPIARSVTDGGQIARSASDRVTGGVGIARSASYRPVLLAGVLVGLAVASRYFMVVLVPVLLVAVYLAHHPRRVRELALARRGAIACVTAVAAFVLASPFVVLDVPEALASLQSEAEQTHAGADGLSPAGNLAWYLTNALPSDLTWPVFAVALVGIAVAARRRQFTPLIVVIGFAALQLVAVSASALHWHRWIIQVLPVFALCAGVALQTLVRNRAMLVVAVALVSAQAVAQLVVYDLQQLQTPPRLLARDWLVQHAPPGATVATEAYSPPLERTRLRPSAHFALAEATLESYRRSGVAYLVASRELYARYFAEPERYPTQVAFYTDLFAHVDEVARFGPHVPLEVLLTTLAGGPCNCNLPPVAGAAEVRIFALAAEREAAPTPGAEPAPSRPWAATSARSRRSSGARGGASARTQARTRGLTRAPADSRADTRTHTGPPADSCGRMRAHAGTRGLTRSAAPGTALQRRDIQLFRAALDGVDGHALVSARRLPRAAAGRAQWRARPMSRTARRRLHQRERDDWRETRAGRQARKALP